MESSNVTDAIMRPSRGLFLKYKKVEKLKLNAKIIKKRTVGINIPRVGVSL